MLGLRDLISQLVDERDELHRRSLEQQAQLEKLKQRCRVLDKKRSDARQRVEHLIQQLPQ